MRTARSRNSGGYLRDVFDDMTSSFPKAEVSGHTGRLNRWTWLIIACHTQLRLARRLVEDLRRP
jgi:hypothetical protein